MEEERIVKNSIVIHAPAARVWETLTSPEKTRQYMFGCIPETDWKPGSTLLWKGIFDGKELTAVKGRIVEIEPGAYLSYTTIDPNQSMADIPENYLTVTYRLELRGGNTELTVTQGDFGKVADGAKRYEEVYQGGTGWNPILLQIKQLAEK